MRTRFTRAAGTLFDALGLLAGAVRAQNEPPLKLEPADGPLIDAPVPADAKDLPGGTITSQPAGPAATQPLPNGTLVSDPAPSVVNVAPAAPGTTVVDAASAAPGTTVVVTPSPAPVWVEGHLQKDPDVFVQVPGGWVKPLIGAPRYVPAYSQRRLGEIRWVPGHWRGGVAPAVTETQPTTARIVQPGSVVVPAPATATVPGYWERGLLGNYRWVPGRVVGY